MNTYSLTNQGRERSINQDQFSNYFHSRFSLLMVADGMGGHNAGEVASQLAVSTAQEYVISNKNESRFDDLLRQAIEAANARIFEASQANPAYERMGTTIVAGIVEEGRLWTAHVGDSRIYLWRNGELKRLTKDHSIVEELMDKGVLSPEEAEDYPDRSAVTRALGVESSVAVDLGRFRLRDGDKVLLCSDGLTKMISDELIAQTIRPEGACKLECEQLIGLANDHGGADNITVTLFEYRS